MRIEVVDNWAWWGQSLGFRFDSSHDSGGMGVLGTMRGNVAFGNMNGFSVKGDNHTILVILYPEYDAKKKGDRHFVQKKKSDESGSGQFQFYLKRSSKGGVYQI